MQIRTISYEISFIDIQKSFFFFFKKIGFSHELTIAAIQSCLGYKTHIIQSEKHISSPFKISIACYSFTHTAGYLLSFNSSIKTPIGRSTRNSKTYIPRISFPGQIIRAHSGTVFCL